MTQVLIEGINIHYEQHALDHPELVVSVTAINSPADMVPKRWKDKLTVLQSWRSSVNAAISRP